jgi:hypothetical protein
LDETYKIIIPKKTIINKFLYFLIDGSILYKYQILFLIFIFVYKIKWCLGINAASLLKFLELFIICLRG